MNWEEVQRLRRSGHYREAIVLGLKLKEKDDSPSLRRHLGWAYYDLIKEQVRNIKSRLDANQRVFDDQQQALMQSLIDYAQHVSNKPDFSLSNIVREVSRIGAHLNEFPNFIHWVKIDGLGPEDWRYNKRDEREYQPVALGVARELAKWCKGHPEAEPSRLNLALEWVERVRQIVQDDDALWIEWDRVYLLRRRGDLDKAASCLSHVLKAKRNDFWVWAEAARINLHENPDLALACFCRALTCQSEDKFIVNVHVELAELLAEREDYAQASREIDQAVAIRERQGWRIPTNLQTLIDTVWYEPGALAACDPRAFYTAHAPNALVLCFEKVKTVAGTYLGTIILKSENPPPDRKPRPLPRFAVMEQPDKPLSLVGPGIRVDHLKPGEPVWLVEGIQEGGQASIVQVATRPDGKPWDCTDERQGIVKKIEEDNVMQVFLDRQDSSVKVREPALAALEGLQPGDGLRLRVATNPKRQRLDIAWAEPGPMPSHPDIQPFAGLLRRNPKGFGFVDNIFISPPLVENLPEEVSHVTGIAVYSRKPKSEDYGWSAVNLRSE